MNAIKRSPAEVIVFTFITCFIYMFYWVYKFSQEIKIYLNKEQINPGVDLLLMVICNYPYSIYWSYQMGQYLVEAGKKAGKPVNDDSIMYLVLAVLGLYFVNMPLMQSKANEIFAEQ